MRLTPTLLLAACLLPAATGCHSRYIDTAVTNRTPDPIQLLEFDYPSASFGTQNLASGATFRYRFKILGSGPTKLLYTDAAHHDHTAPGPTLHEGDEGTLTIDITPASPHWQFTPSQVSK